MEEGLDYPVTIALAYLFLFAYCTARLFVACKLPGAVGVILIGFLFSFFMQEEIHSARNEMQELAFFLVLLTAGFEITFADLNRYVVVMAFFPALVEMAGLAMYANKVMDYSLLQGAVMAVSFCALGDGLVIPKMKEFSQTYPGHTMPRLLFTWAPLEASLTLTIFGVLTPLADPLDVEPAPVAVTLFSNVLILVMTLAGGIVLGSVAGRFVMHRTDIVINDRQLFTGTTVEAFLIVLAVALFAFGAGSESEGGEPFVPLFFAPGSLFQAELFVIVTGSAVAASVSEEVLHALEATMGGVWVFGQLILFSMLGSKTDVSVFKMLPQVLPLMACGLVCRFVGIHIAMLAVRSGLRRPASTYFQDCLFCFISTLPRATLQGALSGIPKAKQFFSHDPKGADVNQFIAYGGKLYIIFCAVVGSILLDICGGAVLAATHARAPTDDMIEDWTESTRSRIKRCATDDGAVNEGPTSRTATSYYNAADIDPTRQMESFVKRRRSSVAARGSVRNSVDPGGISMGVRGRSSTAGTTRTNV